MQVTLTKELEQYVKTKLPSGRYADESEVVREALRTMEQRARTRTPSAFNHSAQRLNLHHVGVVVVAGEGLFFEEAPLGGLEQRAIHEAAPLVGGFGVLGENVDEGRDEEADRATGGIADALAGLRIHQGHHHGDDVAGAAELAVGA